jgi:hypothetical protein
MRALFWERHGSGTDFSLEPSFKGLCALDLRIISPEVGSRGIDEEQAKAIAALPKGHPMPRTWPAMANIASRFLTKGEGGALDYWHSFSPDGKTIVFSRTLDKQPFPLCVCQVPQLPETGARVAAQNPEIRPISFEIVPPLPAKFPSVSIVPRGGLSGLRVRANRRSGYRPWQRMRISRSIGEGF